jgi:quercetin dioxygenase-like cupin family protein
MPADSSPPTLRSRVYPLEIPLPTDPEIPWRPQPLFSSQTIDAGDLLCHASTLAPGHCPHAPHTHDEEELLLVLDGEVDIMIPDAPPSRPPWKRLKPGQLVYYPLDFRHTLETVGQRAANYVMLKWRNGSRQAGEQLGFGHFDLSESAAEAPDAGFRSRFLFEGQTAYLAKLHCHSSTLAPGAGYEPHADAYDVAIVVLAGLVETLGQSAGPYSVIFYPAGEPHGMHNPGSTPAGYVVFEFHGRRSPSDARDVVRQPSLLAKITDRQRWKRKLKRLAGLG